MLIVPFYITTDKESWLFSDGQLSPHEFLLSPEESFTFKGNKGDKSEALIVVLFDKYIDLFII